MSAPAIDIEKLAPEERLQLISDLWESLCDRPEAVPLTDAQRDVLDRRLDELDSGEAEVITWAEAKHRLDRR
jgi:putative addiction module component (TIGR02574 family)